MFGQMMCGADSDEQYKGLWTTANKLGLLPMFSLEGQVVQQDVGYWLWDLFRRSLSHVLNI